LIQIIGCNISDGEAVPIRASTKREYFTERTCDLSDNLVFASAGNAGNGLAMISGI
jgi:hypothetical protein